MRPISFLLMNISFKKSSSKEIASLAINILQLLIHVTGRRTNNHIKHSKHVEPLDKTTTTFIFQREMRLLWIVINNQSSTAS